MGRLWVTPFAKQEISSVNLVAIPLTGDGLTSRLEVYKVRNLLFGIGHNGSSRAAEIIKKKTNKIRNK